MSAWPYPAPVDDGAAAHLGAGLEMPPIALPSTMGEEVSLATLPGLSVVYVYPWTGRPGLSNPPGWDDIPGAHGSTPETEEFRDLYPKFRATGAHVFGLSTQTSDHHRELAHRLRVPFALLSDAKRKFSGALALPVFETGGETFLKRLTLVMRWGRLVHVFYPVHPPDVHPALVLAWLRK